jgi:predicted metal-dependent phosphotriesterase family hydrolase
MKSCLKAYGGLGCDHLFRRIAPLLGERYGIGEEVLDRMLVDTPRRLLDRP